MVRSMQLVRARLHIKEVNMKTFEVLYGFFGLKKSILIWTLEDLKAFVLTEVDETIAPNRTWRSLSGGTWCFDSDQLIKLPKKPNIILRRY